MVDVKTQVAETKSKAKARPGNQNAVTTGLYSRSGRFMRLRDGQVTNYVRRIKAICPWLERQDLFLLRRFAQCELLCDVLYGQLRDKGPLTTAGEAKRLVGEWRKLVQTQGMLANQLGLSPAARAALKADPSNPAAIDISPERAQRAIEVSEE